jgi:hypothetical protein
LVFKALIKIKKANPRKKKDSGLGNVPPAFAAISGILFLLSNIGVDSTIVINT